jgi:hypothetical protein
LDGLQKHAKKRKTLVPCLRVLVGEYYISNDSQHKKSEKVQANLGPNFIALKLMVNVRKAKKKKKVCPICGNSPFVETW